MDAARTAPDDPSDAPAAQRPRRLAHRILTGGVWSLASRVGSMGSLFLLNVALARSLSKHDYSAYLTAASLAPFLALLATLGVTFALLRSLRCEADGANAKWAALRGAAALTLIGSVLTAVAYYAAISFLPGDARWHVLRDFPAWMIGWVTMSAFCIVGATFLQAEDDFRTAALVGARNGGLIPNGATVLAAGAAAAAGVLSIAVLLTIQTLAYFAALAFGAVFIWRLLRRTGVGDVGRRDVAMEPQRGAARYSPRWYFAECWPDLINQLIAVALTEGDLFWVSCLANEEIVADYGVVRNLRLLIVAPLMVASIVLPPFVAELYAKRDMPRLERVLRGAAAALSVPSLAALLVMIIAPETVIRWIFGREFVEAATAVRISSLGAIAFVLTGNTAMALTMTGRHRALMVNSVGGLAFYLVISPPLVASYGLNGAAAAFAIQIIVQRSLMVWRVKQLVGIWTIPLTSWAAARQEWHQLLRGRK